MKNWLKKEIEADWKEKVNIFPWIVSYKTKIRRIKPLKDMKDLKKAISDYNSGKLIYIKMFGKYILLKVFIETLFI